MTRKKESAPPPAVLRYPLPHPAQALILKQGARFRVVACGRRFGKTELAKLDVMLTALEGGVAWWVAPTLGMAGAVWASLLKTLEPFASHVDRQHHTLSLPNGGAIAVKSGHDPHHLRGAGLHSVVIDEAAYCDEEVWQVLRPALSDKSLLRPDGTRQPARALLLSTPRGRNWFWGLYQKGLDPLEPDWASWRLPTAANPFIPSAEIMAARRDLPARLFAQEYEAAFLDDGGAVFSNIRACIAARQPLPNEGVCFGVDWGRLHDYTAIIVLGMESRAILEIARFNQLTWAAQRARLSGLAKRWKPRLILAEANSIGSPNIEALQAEGLPIRPFTTTSASKAALIDGLVLALETEAVGLVDDPVLLQELSAYSMERTAGGDFRYSAPHGGHDDLVMALALALLAVRTPKARVSSYA